MTLVKKNSLETNERLLVETIHDLYFGRIIGLCVLSGHPLFDPPPKLVHEIKFGGENGQRPESKTRDFTLKSQIIEMLDSIGRLGDGTLVTIEVKHGLPFSMSYEETIGA